MLKRLLAISAGAVMALCILTSCDTDSDKDKDDKDSKGSSSQSIFSKEDLKDANTDAKRVYTAAATYCTKQETKGFPVEDGVYYSEDNNEVSNGINSFIESDNPIVWKVYIKDYAPYIAVASRREDSRYIGTYPKKSEGKCKTDITEITPASNKEYVNSEGVYGA